MEIMGVVFVVVGLIQIVTLIMFFIMVGNISTIKNTILKFGDGETVEYLIYKADEETYIGNTDKAKEYLLRAKHKSLSMGITRYQHTNGSWYSVEKTIEQRMDKLK
jgi:hypothetical protein